MVKVQPLVRKTDTVYLSAIQGFIPLVCACVYVCRVCVRAFVSHMIEETLSGTTAFILCVHMCLCAFTFEGLEQGLFVFLRVDGKFHSCDIVLKLWSHVLCKLQEGRTQKSQQGANVYALWWVSGGLHHSEWMGECLRISEQVNGRWWQQDSNHTDLRSQQFRRAYFCHAKSCVFFLI